MRIRAPVFLAVLLIAIAGLALITASMVGQAQANSNTNSPSSMMAAIGPATNNGGGEPINPIPVVALSNTPQADISAVNSNVTGTYERASMNFPDATYLQAGAVYINLGKTLANLNSSEVLRNTQVPGTVAVMSLQNQADGGNKNAISGNTIFAALMCQIPTTCELPASNSS